MRRKKIMFSNFSCLRLSEAWCIRPDTEQQLIDYMAHSPPQSILVRGSGLSYNDSCFNTNGLIIDSSRLNHLIDFDEQTGVALCQANVSFQDLLLLHPDFIPAVIPGTIHATVAGGIAHDIHGKNNHQAGSFGQHVLWFELLLNHKKIRCSPEEYSDLFYASIAGLGLSGILTRVALRLQKKSRFVAVKNQQIHSLAPLLLAMTGEGLTHDYQVAWLDLLQEEPRALLSLADHCDPFPLHETKTYKIPKLPFGLIRNWNMKLFNQFFFHQHQTEEKLGLEQFNNPLDKLQHWNRLYGPKGLIQFQAVFAQEHALETIQHLLRLIRLNNASPTLAVLKLFTQPGVGLLSFCQPGFTLAIDFIHNEQAKKAISAMNQLISEIKGRVYLAKDALLNAAQYERMYTTHPIFSQVLQQYHCSLHSDLGQRLGILK